MQPKSNSNNPTLRIAIADDSSLNRMLWKALFKEWSPIIEIDEAKNGLDLVELVRNNRYDVVLTDVNMPIMDGVEATKYIRDFNPFVPIIGVSGSTSEMGEADFKAAGMSAFLSKPVEFAVLLREIGKVLKLDLLDSTANPELSGNYSRVRKVSISEENFIALKSKLNQEISSLILTLPSAENQESASHILVNKFLYVNDMVMLELAKDCEKLIKRNLPFDHVLSSLAEKWDSFQKTINPKE
ncbi:MAG: CheY-like chemotaxis protein [Parvicellaceae bacterium]|jgi:CheY-like chemotaxis protein